jgi:hypothetical protein
MQSTTGRNPCCNYHAIHPTNNFKTIRKLLGRYGPSLVTDFETFESFEVELEGTKTKEGYYQYNINEGMQL